jgi:dihydrofolate synthase / folylpolyglutamate synthase
MTYNQTLEYLYSLLPVFHRDGKKAFKADLSNTIALCQKLDNPQNKLQFVHIAGTNGKGSSSHYLSSILSQAGLKTGLYTSPHLVDFTERFKIDGKEMPKQFVIDFVKNNKEIIESLKPSFFELSVAMAFQFFYENKVDIVVLETGLGGRLDSTNVIKPIVSLITNIGFDHKDILGDTLEKIAFEKAGIIKVNTPIVVSERTNEMVDLVFINKAKEKNADLYFAEDFFEIDFIERNFECQQIKTKNLVTNEVQILETDLLGNYQLKNLKGVLKVVDLLKSKFTISNQAIEVGVKRVKKNTGLLGRWQILNQNPITITDVGHNEHGLKETILQLSKIVKTSQITFILGFLADKDLDSILALFPKDSNYIFCKPNSLRALDLESLKTRTLDFKAQYIENVNDALDLAMKNISPNEIIYIGGSTFVVADIKNLKNAS